MKSALESGLKQIKSELVAEAKKANHPYCFGHPTVGMIFAGNLPELSKRRHDHLTQALDQLEFADQVDVEGFHARSNRAAFLFNNEMDAGDCPDFLSTCPFQELPDDTLRVALLVGESNFLSMLFSLARHAQHVMMVDIDPLVLAHNRHLLQCLRESKSPLDFAVRYLDKSKNPVLKTKHTAGSMSFYSKVDETQHVATQKNLVWDDSLLARFLMDKKVTFGAQYFLSNEERFYGCKAVAEHMRFSFVQIDLFDIEQVTQLKVVLDQQQATITACGLTNLFFHDGDKPYSHQLTTWQPTGRFEACMKVLVPENASIPTLFSIYPNGGNLRLRCLQSPTVLGAFNRSKYNLLLSNVSAIGTKYEFTDHKFDINELFRYVAAKGETYELEYLLQYRAILPELMRDPTMRENIAAARRKGTNLRLDVNAVGPSGRTALHFAVIHGQRDNAELLLAQADVRQDRVDNKEQKIAEQYAKGDLVTLFNTLARESL